jgi:hypothetical protein
MSRLTKAMGLSLICLAGMVVLAMVGPAQGGKTPSPPIPLWANFESTWYDGAGQGYATNILNDDAGLYVDTTDTKKIKYGVEVKYYPPGSWDTRGRFRMNVDQAGVLGRFVRLLFNTPSTSANCVSTKDGCGIDPMRGGMGTIETRTIEISTQLVLVENADGALVRDVNQPIGMDLMKTGDSKIVGLGISIIPDDPDFNYTYLLGQFTDPANYNPNLTCQSQNYLWGPAELYCRTAGTEWEFRPCSKAYVNEPDNRWRLLQGNVLLDYWSVCKLRKWNMPFVLRVGKR